MIHDPLGPPVAPRLRQRRITEPRPSRRRFVVEDEEETPPPSVESVRDRAKAEAKRRGVSLNWVITRALARWLEHNEGRELDG